MNVLQIPGTASVESSHVILMTSARYGRMGVGRCISADYNLGCSRYHGGDDENVVDNEVDEEKYNEDDDNALNEDDDDDC